MEISLLLRGLAIGLAIAAPVGPIGILCIRQSLAFGWLHGFVAGLGAATADAMYGCVAAFGLTFVTNFLRRFCTVVAAIEYYRHASKDKAEFEMG